MEQTHPLMALLSNKGVIDHVHHPQSNTTGRLHRKHLKTTKDSVRLEPELQLTNVQCGLRLVYVRPLW